MIGLAILTAGCSGVHCCIFPEDKEKQKSYIHVISTGFHSIKRLITLPKSKALWLKEMLGMSDVSYTKKNNQPINLHIVIVFFIDANIIKNKLIINIVIITIVHIINIIIIIFIIIIFIIISDIISPASPATNVWIHLGGEEQVWTSIEPEDPFHNDKLQKSVTNLLITNQKQGFQ